MRPPHLLLPVALLSCLFFADSLSAQFRPGGFPPPSPPRPVNPPGGFNIGNPGGFNVGNPGGMNIGNPGMNIGNRGGMNIGNPGFGPQPGPILTKTWYCKQCGRTMGTGNSPPAFFSCPCGLDYHNGVGAPRRIGNPGPLFNGGNNPAPAFNGGNNPVFTPSFNTPAPSPDTTAADVGRGLKTMTIFFGIGLIAVGGLALAGTAFLVVFSLKGTGSSRRRR